MWPTNSREHFQQNPRSAVLYSAAWLQLVGCLHNDRHSHMMPSAEEEDETEAEDEDNDDDGCVAHQARALEAPAMWLHVCPSDVAGQGPPSRSTWCICHAASCARPVGRLAGHALCWYTRAQVAMDHPVRSMPRQTAVVATRRFSSSSLQATRPPCWLCSTRIREVRERVNAMLMLFVRGQHLVSSMWYSCARVMR